MAERLRLADSQRFRTRPATKEDVPHMTEVFFRSFNAPFWQYFLPDDASKRAWWDEAWTLGIENSVDRSFVVEDSSHAERKIVAFSRWQVPQADGNQERKWPEMKEGEWDMELASQFFGGMAENREVLMEKRMHWFLEMLGVHEDYQEHGIGATLIRWGTEQADQARLETYLDASEKGKPYYIKRHGFVHVKEIEIPDRPSYGSFQYTSLVRRPQT